jgi:hypothetical protein
MLRDAAALVRNRRMAQRRRAIIFLVQSNILERIYHCLRPNSSFTSVEYRDSFRYRALLPEAGLRSSSLQASREEIPHTLQAIGRRDCAYRGNHCSVSCARHD